MKKKIYLIEIIGILFVIVLGSLWHFIYNWTGRNIIAGILCPVNESVWEHMKLGFWPVLIYTLIENRYINHRKINIMAVKGVGILFMQLFIIVFFYTYTHVTGQHFLIIDILSFFAGVVLCYLISAKLIIAGKYTLCLRTIGISVLVVHAVLLVIFTFYPPRMPMFKDSASDTYGLQTD